MAFGRRKVEKVSQVQFVEETTTLLQEAMTPTTKLEDTVAKGTVVSKRLGDIASGSLIVEPPIGHDQFEQFKNQAATIVALGQKGLDALSETARTHEAATVAATSEAPAFTGSGAGVKS